jgi:hypothetical protein
VCHHCETHTHVSFEWQGECISEIQVCPSADNRITNEEEKVVLNLNVLHFSVSATLVKQRERETEERQ